MNELVRGVATLRKGTINYVACCSCGRLKVDDHFLDHEFMVKDILTTNFRHGYTGVSFSHELCPKCQMKMTGLNIILPKGNGLVA